jgi:dTDP-4-dehydrorhamnose reductase
LGTAFLRLLGKAAVPLTRHDLDLVNPGTIGPMFDSLAPEAVINCAAYTNVDQAEREEKLATTVNGDAVGVMADWASDHDCPFMTFSTDYVFSGNAATPYVETSPPDPINAYGRSKLKGEQQALAAGGLVIRTSWLISGSHPNFVSKILQLAAVGEARVVDDQHGSPTICHDLAVTALEALHARTIGLLHVTNRGVTTWFELAQAAVAEAGWNPRSIKACSTTDYPAEARRPSYSVLSSERLQRARFTAPPHWQESLPAVVREIKTWI